MALLMLRAILVLLFLMPGLAGARDPAATDVRWYTVLLDGRKIGQFENRREVHGERVLTRQAMRIELDRAGTRVAMSSEESSEETLDGRPLAFANETRMSGSETSIAGSVDGSRMRVRIGTAGGFSERELDWPPGALLAEGLRLALLDVAPDEGAVFRPWPSSPRPSR